MPKTKLYWLIAWGGIVSSFTSFTALRSYAEREMQLEPGEYQVMTSL